MFYEPDSNDHGLPYNPVKACVVPRPIGWITTVDGAGKVNAAPFSFFNVLSYNPPFCLFSSGGHAEDEKEKDSVRNARETGEFVYNMATWDLRDAMSETGMIVDRAADELSETGLEPLPSNIVKAPRIKGSPVQFECKLHEIVVLPGNVPSHIHHVVFGRVVGVHVDDSVIDENGLLDIDRIRPIARLGYKDYCWVDSSTVFQMDKRSPEETIAKPQQAAE